MKKTYLLDNTQREHVMTSLLKQYGSLRNLEFLSFSSWLEKQGKPGRDSLDLLHAKRILDQNKEQFELLRPMLDYPDTIRALWRLAKELHDYAIDAATLPEVTQKDHEVKRALALLHPLSTARSDLNNQLDTRQDIASLVLYPEAYTPFQHRLVQRLADKGATVLDFPVRIPADHHFYHGLNQRQECEACAQWLLNHSLDDAVIILCDPNEIHVLQTVFERYQIPLQSTLQQINPEASNFIKLYTYFSKPSLSGLLDILENQLLPLTSSLDFAAYIRRFDLDLNAITAPFNHVQALVNPILDPREYQALLRQEEQAEATRQELMVLLAVPAVPFRACVEGSYQLLCRIHPTMDLAVISTYLSTHMEILETLDHPEPLFFDQLKRLTSSQGPHEGIEVRDLHHLPVNGSRTILVLSANQAHFPGISLASGLIDETYLAQIEGYPPMSERIQQQTRYLHHLYTLSDTLVISFVDGDYQGKSRDVAYEAEEAMRPYTTLERWPLIQHSQIIPQMNHQLTPETAHALFFKDNILKGSISRFETFFSCPFRFFLNYGLGLDDLDDTHFETRILGTVQHALMQALTTTYNKAYPNVSDSVLETLIDPFIQRLIDLYPKRKPHYLYVKTTLMASMRDTLDFLKGYEEKVEFKPAYSEWHFDHPDLGEKLKALHLTGIVDRIDSTEDGFILIDYKSSAHDLKEDSVKAGEQLQLLTYGWIVEKLLGKPVYGVYYLNLKEPRLSGSYASFSSTKGLVYQSEDNLEATWISKRRFSGWTFHSLNGLLHDPIYIKGFKLSKSNEVESPLMNADRIKTLLEELYRYLLDELASGRIPVDPADEHCRYCHYQSICHVLSPYKKSEPLLMKDVSLKESH